MHVVFLAALTLLPIGFYFQTNLIGTKREEELTVVMAALAAGIFSGKKSRHKIMQITEDRKWYYYVDESGETHRLPATRPYNTGFSPSRIDRLKYVKEFGGPTAAVSSALGAALDYSLSSADTILDGSLEAIALAMAGLLTIGIYKTLKKAKCPYCSQKHKPNLKVCPITDLLLWYWEEQEPFEVYRRETITGFEEVVEYLSRNYYPIAYKEASRIASEVIEAGDLPIRRSEFGHYLSEHSHSPDVDVHSFDEEARRVMLLREDAHQKKLSPPQ